MEKVRVYRVNEFDGVAARSAEEAREWYLELIGDDNYIADEIREVPSTNKVWEDENKTTRIFVGDILRQYWKGVPFIAYSTEY